MSKLRSFRLHSTFSILLCLMTMLVDIPIAHADSIDVVALVLAADNLKSTSVEVDFYQSVAAQIAASPIWRLALRAEFSKYLDAAPPRQPLPILDSRKLQAVLALDAKTKALPNSQMIPTLQKMLDSLLYTGAVISYCSRTEERKISGCGVYFYNRSEQRLLAVAEKKFAVPLDNPVRWAKPLADSLIAGVKDRSRADDAKKMQEFMVNSNDDEDSMSPNRYAMGFGVFAETFRAGKVARSSYASFRLSPTLLKDESGVSLDLAYGFDSRKQDGKVRQAYSMYDIGLRFFTGVDAMDVLHWQFGLGAGLRVQNLSTSYGDLRERSPFLVCAPALLWYYSRSLIFGVEAHYLQMFNGTQQGSGALANEKFNSGGFSGGMTIRAEL